MSAFVERADRLRLQIPITYRRHGDEEWFVSHVVNVSESGILFGPTGLEPGAAVEMIVSPPAQLGFKVAGPHKCAGTIVRTTEAGTAAARVTFWRGLLES
ncbi:MAG: PilZ domain-containing protein [Acidobacteria bacterium]|nr:PilZ domain-containing protein [Acidobacteriota bacterium]